MLADPPVAAAVLEIVDQTADPSMLKFRRRLLEAVHNAGLVGRKQVASGHAVLLLQVGRGGVADLSHNGTCNNWADADMVGAPNLFRGTHDPDEVRIAAGRGNLETHSPFSIMHMSSET